MGSLIGRWVEALTRRTFTAILKMGPIPEHVAFIMDGNRRFAERKKIESAQGHAHGYSRLLKALEWCLELGIVCVSVYAFSIDNYKRSKEEIDLLMELMESKLKSLLEDELLLKQYNVRVQVIGDLALAPRGVQLAAMRIMNATREHKRSVLNICFSYSSSQELQQAVHDTAENEGEIDSHLYTRGCPPVDVVIRTSGESRLSDFLVKQCSTALMIFTRVFWPDFSFIDLASAIRQFQINYEELLRLRRQYDVLKSCGLDEVPRIGIGRTGGDALVGGPGFRLFPSDCENQKGKNDSMTSPDNIASPQISSSPSSLSMISDLSPLDNSDD